VSALDGFVAPFRRHVAEKRKRLGLFDFKWPRLQEAVDWLLGQQILTKEQLAKRIDDATKGQLGDFDIWAGSINDQLRNELAQSVHAGEGRDDWKKRMDKASLGFTSNAETTGRTWMHRSFTQGTKESLADPVVGELFPYWLYESTSDSRTRATHRAMGGKVAFRGSPLADEMERLANEYGCRCTLVPLTVDDAKAKGIDDNTGWVEPADDQATKPEQPDEETATEETPPVDAGKAAAVQAKLDEIIRQLAEQGRRDIAAHAAARAAINRYEQSHERYNKLAAQPGQSAKEMAALRAQIKAERKAAQEATRKVNQDDDAKRLEALDVLAVPQAEAVQVKVISDMPKDRRKPVDDAQTWLGFTLKNRKFVTGDTANGIAVKVRPIEQSPWWPELKRSHKGGDIVYMNADDDAQIVIHEIGHQLEDNPEVHKAAKAFLASRVDVEKRPVKIADATGEKSYKEYEVTYGKDNWEQLLVAMGHTPENAARKANYIGKAYPYASTEVVSVGIELMYQNAARFAAADPEYFRLIASILRGEI